MSITILADVRLHRFLLRIDRQLAAELRAKDCRRCGSKLDVGHFRRKPRGCPRSLGPEWDKRLSFSCRRCRKRATPESVRYLGRRVYVATVVVLASAMMNGPTAFRLSKLQAEIRCTRETLARWRRWWTEDFAESRFFKAKKALFARSISTETLPVGLLDSFRGSPRVKLIRMLKWLSPISTVSLGDCAVF